MRIRERWHLRASMTSCSAVLDTLDVSESELEVDELDDELDKPQVMVVVSEP